LIFDIVEERTAGLAQLVEHLICNQGVAGSIPATGTIIPQKMQTLSRLRLGGAFVVLGVRVTLRVTADHGRLPGVVREGQAVTIA